jgi:hypothetical protein
LDSYIFDPKTKQVNNQVTRKIKETNNVEDLVTKEAFFWMIQQEIHFVVSIVMTMFQGTKDNIINMTKTIHEYKDHIEILKEELDYAQR